jgi:ribosomal protein S18 acetylase RimI-like enzyme
MRQVEYRTAHESDVAAIVELVESAYRGEASRVGWTTEADVLDGQRTDAEMVREILADPDSRLLVAERAGEIVACCHLEHHEGYAYFGMFAVRPGKQNGGIGRAVLAEAERQVRADWRVREMHMTVIGVRDELIAWYERRGYARTGKKSPFPYDDERFGQPLRDDLDFELLVKEL